jgi:hypothetical protein
MIGEEDGKKGDGKGGLVRDTNYIESPFKPMSETEVKR